MSKIIEYDEPVWKGMLIPIAILFVGMVLGSALTWWILSLRCG